MSVEAEMVWLRFMVQIWRETATIEQAGPLT
jgi:hypothetical protein